jgi:hypothetical protein
MQLGTSRILFFSTGHARNGGRRVLSELRQCEEVASTRVALFTGRLRCNSDRAEGTWFLPKPIAMATLLSNVQAILL